MPEERRDSELILPLGTYAFVLDTNKGWLSTVSGPTKLTLTNTDETVVYDPKIARRFRKVGTAEAVQRNSEVPKGSYAILRNPAQELRFPEAAKQKELSTDLLEVGKVVNLSGPKTFALWPGQEVEIIEGHHLRTNEYLVVRVYDEEEARRNWGKGTAKVAEPLKAAEVQTLPPGQVEPPTPTSPTPSQQPSPPTTTFWDVDPDALVIGQLLLIKGTDVSFYIPPTGIEVIKDETDKFVRQAETLERLEYCLLADQDGNKRYVRGPEVVFPLPTEKFKLNDDDERKSRAYELNEISGLHIKVIADYEDSIPSNMRGNAEYLRALREAGFHVSIDGAAISNKEGEELFITGKVQAIYFPRIEHAILTWGTQQKSRSRYHAINVAPGEARYVMNRLTGQIHLVRGEAMLLPDPRTEVIVQRVLSDRECARYYPGNAEVLAYNRMLRQQNTNPELAAMMNLSNVQPSAAYRTGHLSTSVAGGSALTMSSSRAADTIDRTVQYTTPRSMIVDPKFEGAPKISPWTGHAVQLVNAKGERVVVVGPQTVNLDFDQHLEPLFLSTKTPKEHDKLLETAYLKIVNNVSDEVEVITKDLVTLRIRLKYLLRFDEAQKERWFNVDNYVQLLVDHFRSVISNLARKEAAPSFYLDAASILRNWVLGVEDAQGNRSLHSFAENGMSVYDLEVVSVTITDAAIAAEMKKTQTEILKANFAIAQLETKSNLVKRTEVLTREIAAEEFETLAHKGELAVRTVVVLHEKEQKDAELQVFRQSYKLDEARKMAEVREVIQTTESKIELQRWEPDKQKEIHELSQECERLIKEAQAMKTKSESIQPALIEAFVALAQSGAFEVATKHLSSLAILHDLSLGGMAEQIFKGTPFESTLENLSRLGKGKLIEQPAASA